MTDTNNAWKVCKRNGYHTWSDKDGSDVESIGEDINEMQVVFTCKLCGAQAEGTVTWDNDEARR